MLGSSLLASSRPLLEEVVVGVMEEAGLELVDTMRVVVVVVVMILLRQLQFLVTKWV